MAQDNNFIRYYLTTYSSFAHNYLIGVLSSNDIKYTYSMLETEESYSKFTIISDIYILNKIKQTVEEDPNGTAITIEYGSF